MHTSHNKDDLRAHVRELRKSGSIGLVPTMGHLHKGHMALVEKARAENDHVLASIFVNPTQFGSADDLENYPKSVEADLDMLREAGVDGVFVPASEVMYHPAAQTIIETTELSSILLGALRPGHFVGVATIVVKLFNLFQPDRAYFGEKDYQQLAVIRTMVRDLDIDVEIKSIPTIRDSDGLALSSRNARLTNDARKAAPILYKACIEAERIAAGGASIEDIKQTVHNMISSEPLANIQSIDLCNAETLEDASGPLSEPVVILLAVRFEPVLLIDQYVLTP